MDYPTPSGQACIKLVSTAGQKAQEGEHRETRTQWRREKKAEGKEAQSGSPVGPGLVAGRRGWRLFGVDDEDEARSAFRVHAPAIAFAGVYKSVCHHLPKDGSGD